MNIGIIGAGHMAQAVGWLAIRAGHRVMLCNSRGPQSLLRLREATFVPEGHWRHQRGIRT